MATATSPKQVVPMLADPLPLQPGWLAAEAGRVGQEAGTVRFGRLAAKVILVSSGERRAGYTVADLVGGPSHLPATVASGQTAVVTALGSKLPAILGATQTREPAEYARLLARVEERADVCGAVAVTVGPIPDTPDWTPLVKALGAANYRAVTQPPEAVLSIDESGMAGLLVRLSKSQRKNVRRHREVFTRSGGRIELLPPGELRTSEAAELLADHYRKFGHDTSTDEAADRIRRAISLPGAVALVAADQNGLRGISVLAVDPGRSELYPRLSACRRDHVFSYFNLIFYGRVDVAAARGVTTLFYGDETYGPKVQRGCALRDLKTYVRILGPEPTDFVDRCAALSAQTVAAVRAQLPTGFADSELPPANGTHRG